MKKLVLMLLVVAMFLATGCKKDASWFNGTTWEAIDGDGKVTLRFTSESICSISVYGDGYGRTGTFCYVYSGTSFIFDWTQQEEDFFDGFMHCTGTFSSKDKTITIYTEEGYPITLTKQ